MTFGEKIKKLRLSRSLSQENVAEYLNVSRQSVQKWEADINYPEIETLKQIAKLFDVSFDFLLDESMSINTNSEKEKESYGKAWLSFLTNGKNDLSEFRTLSNSSFPEASIVCAMFSFEEEKMNYYKKAAVLDVQEGYWGYACSLYAKIGCPYILDLTNKKHAEYFVNVLSAAKNHSVDGMMTLGNIYHRSHKLIESFYWYFRAYQYEHKDGEISIKGILSEWICSGKKVNKTCTDLDVQQFNDSVVLMNHLINQSDINYFNKLIECANNKSVLISTYLADYYEHIGDKVNAKKYYKLASDYGDPHATRCYADLLITSGDSTNAFEYYLLAANKGDAVAMFVTGEHYKSLGNSNLAAYYYGMSHSRGYEYAFSRLQQLSEGKIDCGKEQTIKSNLNTSKNETKKPTDNNNPIKSNLQKISIILLCVDFLIYFIFKICVDGALGIVECVGFYLIPFGFYFLLFKKKARKGWTIAFCIISYLAKAGSLLTYFDLWLSLFLGIFLSIAYVISMCFLYKDRYQENLFVLSKNTKDAFNDKKEKEIKDCNNKEDDEKDSFTEDYLIKIPQVFSFKDVHNIIAYLGQIKSNNFSSLTKEQKKIVTNTIEKARNYVLNNITQYISCMNGINDCDYLKTQLLNISVFNNSIDSLLLARKQEIKETHKTILTVVLSLAGVIAMMFACIPIVGAIIANNNMTSGNYSEAKEAYLDTLNNQKMANLCDVLIDLDSLKGSSITNDTKESFYKDIDNIINEGYCVKINYSDFVTKEYSDFQYKADLLNENFLEGYCVSSWSLSSVSYAKNIIFLDLNASKTNLCYSIIYNNCDGCFLPGALTTYASFYGTYSLPLASKVGYSFLGWYADVNLSQEIKTLNLQTGTVNVFAKWEINSFSIQFNIDSTISTITLKYNEKIPFPETEAKFGYNSSWLDKNGKIIDSNTSKCVENATFTFAYTPIKYTANFNLNGGSWPYDNNYIYTIESNTYIIPSPSKLGYDFEGWYYNQGSITSIDKGTTGNLTITAKWKAIEYSIVYNLQNGTNSINNPSSYTIESNQIILSEPSKTGYTFLGWERTDLAVTSVVTEIDSKSTGNIVLNALWQANNYKITLSETKKYNPSYYRITFKFNDNKTPDSIQTIESNQSIQLPDIPKNNLLFSGWLDEKTGTRYDFSSPITKDLVLIAKWRKYDEEEVYINCYNNDSENYKEYNDGAGHTYSYFTALTTGEISIYHSNIITSDHNSYIIKIGQWSSDTYVYSQGTSGYKNWVETKYSVICGHTYFIKNTDYNGGCIGIYIVGNDPVNTGKGDDSLDTDLTYDVTYGSAFSVYCNVTKQNATFVGWFDEKGNQYTDEKGKSINNYLIDSDIILYAKWV